jgi:hypothetical protein
VDRFLSFIEQLQSDPRACRVAVQFKRQGVNLRQVFAGLTVYAENRSVAPERKRRGKADRQIINRGVRENGLAPEVARWFLDRSELAHSTDGLSRAHNTDSLASVVIYVEAITGRRMTMSALAYLVEASNRALGRKPFDVDPETIGRELRRHKEKNHLFLQILKNDIIRKL